MAVSRSIKDSSCKSAFWSQPNWILCMLPKVLDRLSFHLIELGCMAKCISIMSTSNGRCVPIGPWISLYLVICHHLPRIARSSGGLGAWQMIQDDSRWQITNTKGNQKWGESYFYFSDVCPWGGVTPLVLDIGVQWILHYVFPSRYLDAYA